MIPKNTNWALKLLLAAVATLSQLPSSAQQNVVTLSGGLEATINWVGRNLSSEQTTISASIKNSGEQVAFILHLGPVTVIDNGGNSYRYPKVSGVADCSGWGGGEECLRNSLRENQKYVQTMTRIDPGRSITVNYSLTSGKGPATIVSVATVFAVRLVDDIVRDNAQTDDQRIRQIQRINFSFPAAPITMAR